MSFPVQQAFPQQAFGQQTFAAPQQAFAVPQQAAGVPGAQFVAPQQQFYNQQMGTGMLPSRATFAAATKAKKPPPKKRTFAQSIADADKDHNYLYWKPTIENAKAAEQFRYKKGTNKSIADASSAFTNATKDVNIFFTKYATNRPGMARPEQIYFVPVFLYAIPRPIITPPSATNPAGSITYSPTELTVVRLFGSWIIVANKLAEYIREIAVSGGIVPTEELYSKIKNDAASFTNERGITQQIIEQGASSTDQRTRDLYATYTTLAKLDQSKRGERRKESKWDPIYQRFKRLIGPAPLKLKGGKGRAGKVTTLSQAFITNFPAFAIELLTIRRNNMTPGMAQQPEKYQSYREKIRDNGTLGIVTQKVSKRPQNSWIIDPLNVAVESSTIANTFLELARKVGESNKPIADLVATARIVPPLHATGATTVGFQFAPSAQYAQFQAFQQYPGVAAARQSITAGQTQAQPLQQLPVQSFFAAPGQQVQQLQPVNPLQQAVLASGAGGQIQVAPLQPQQVLQPVMGIQSQEIASRTPSTTSRASPLLNVQPLASPTQGQVLRAASPSQQVAQPLRVASPSQQFVQPLASPTQGQVLRAASPSQQFVQPLAQPTRVASPSQQFVQPQVAAQPFTVDLSGVPSLGQGSPSTLQQSVLGPATGQETVFSAPQQQ